MKKMFLVAFMAVSSMAVRASSFPIISSEEENVKEKKDGVLTYCCTVNIDTNCDGRPEVTSYACSLTSQEDACNKAFKNGMDYIKEELAP
ncbi:MAG: hypothetical protein OHK0045_15730 [Raineya sp.]